MEHAHMWARRIALSLALVGAGVIIGMAITTKLNAPRSSIKAV